AFHVGRIYLNRLSVPSRSRRIFPRWAKTIKAAIPIEVAIKTLKSSLEAYRSNTNMGMQMAATIDPSDTYLVNQTTTRKTTAAPAMVHGARIRKTPIAVATPLPPRKCNQTGNKCPRITAKATSTIVQSGWFAKVDGASVAVEVKINLATIIAAAPLT